MVSKNARKRRSKAARAQSSQSVSPQRGSPERSVSPLSPERSENSHEGRAVSSRVAAFENAAQSESMLAHEKRDLGAQSLDSRLDANKTPDLRPKEPTAGSGIEQGGRRDSLNSAPLSPAFSAESISGMSSPEPEIPQRSIARAVEPERAVMLEAKLTPLLVGKPVVREVEVDASPTESGGASGAPAASSAEIHRRTENGEAEDGSEAFDSSDLPTITEITDQIGDSHIAEQPSLQHEGTLEPVALRNGQGANGNAAEKDFAVDAGAESDFDPDSYFSGPEDVIVDTTPVMNNGTPSATTFDFDMDAPQGSPVSQIVEGDGETAVSPDDAGSDIISNGAHETPDDDASAAAVTNAGASRLSDANHALEDPIQFDEDETTLHGVKELESVKRPEAVNGMIRKVDGATSGHEAMLADPVDLVYTAHELSSPRSDAEPHLRDGLPRANENKAGLALAEGDDDVPQIPHTLEPPPSLGPHLSLANPSSPDASPRAYKYAQSPLPEASAYHRPEPPIIGVGVVGFHHKRGPEVEYWVGAEEKQSKLWPYLPFQSLPDGSHQFEENVCYFTLLYDRNRNAATSLTFSRDEDGHIKEGTSDFRNVTTLFAIACSRQVAADKLQISGDEEYSRSTVQKSVVVIASKPIFGPIKEKLTVVTRSYFEQHNFGDREIINHFYENMVQMPLWMNENDLQMGMNLQRVVHDFGTQVLVLLKAMLAEHKILFYANDTDVLGTTQFALISLIPNLINHLEDSGSPLLSSYELYLEKPHTLKSSDRQSLLAYMGLPLQIFAGGGVLTPFVPLQQFDDLKQPETRYGMMGTTNKLFLDTELDFDVVVDIDSHKIIARKAEIAQQLQLSEADKAFAASIVEAVNSAWDTEDSWQPQALGYYGGEDYIRHEFEEYLMALLASAKYAKKVPEKDERTQAISQWGAAWVDRWRLTNNYRVFDKSTDDLLYELVEPVHPGVKLLKPSGFERFLGLFRRSEPSPMASPTAPSVATLPSPQSSAMANAPHTPQPDSGSFDALPTTPRRWFWNTPREATEPKQLSSSVQVTPQQSAAAGPSKADENNATPGVTKA